VERGLPVAERTHDARRQIVLAVDASRIAALDEKERGRPIDQHLPGVRGPTYSDPVLDLEPEARQAGHLVVESGRFVLAPASLGESQGLRAVLAMVHHHPRA
jgi:hypothetical protein